MGSEPGMDAGIAPHEPGKGSSDVLAARARNPGLPANLQLSRVAAARPVAEPLVRRSRTI